MSGLFKIVQKQFLNLMRNFLFFKTTSMQKKLVVFNEFDRRISDCAIQPSYFVIFFSLLFGPFHSKSFPLYILNLLFYFVCPLTFLKCLFFFFSLYILKLLLLSLYILKSLFCFSLYILKLLFVSLYNLKIIFFVPLHCQTSAVLSFVALYFKTLFCPITFQNFSTLFFFIL